MRRPPPRRSAVCCGASRPSCGSWSGRNLGPDAEIVNVFTAMLADPWVQRVRNLG